METRHLLMMLLVLTPLTITGCATPIHGSVFAQEDGSYKGIATADDERTAYKMAGQDAKTTCKEREEKRNFVVLNQSSKYIGPNMAANEKGLTRLTMKVLEFAAKTRSDENYKVEVHFKCR